MSRGGPKAPINPAHLVALLDEHSTYEVLGHPRRRRLLVNGIPVADNDARMIRRWRAGTIKGVTVKSANALLARHNLNPIR
jgi:hypothetical protein